MYMHMHIHMHTHTQTHTHTQVCIFAVPVMHIVFSQTMTWNKDGSPCKPMKEDGKLDLDYFCSCSQKYPV